MDSGNCIKIEGPPDESDKARDILENQANELKTKMSFAEISIDAKYHKHIIGKGGSNGKNQNIILTWGYKWKYALFIFNTDDTSCAPYEIRKCFCLVYL